jgi:hypothetical protein
MPLVWLLTPNSLSVSAAFRRKSGIKYQESGCGATSHRSGGDEVFIRKLFGNAQGMALAVDVQDADRFDHIYYYIII